MVTINIQKKDLFLISAILVFLVGVGIVIAYGGNTPALMGHSAGEISGAECAFCFGGCGGSFPTETSKIYPVATDPTVYYGYGNACTGGYQSFNNDLLDDWGLWLCC